MADRIAIVDGVRTPMCKAGGPLAKVAADDLGARVVSELMARLNIADSAIDELIFGNVSQPVNAANIARVIALKAGLPEAMPAYTVHRNCGSGAESITTAADKIRAGRADAIIAGGTESMSNVPLLVSEPITELFAKLARAKSAAAKVRTLLRLRPSHLKPIIGIVEGLTDPICGMLMGNTAEILAREFHVTRAEQDAYALLSHERAVAAQRAGWLEEEIHPLPLPPSFGNMLLTDDGPRAEQSIEKLAKLRPYFDRHNGTVTVGNACPLTDGAAAVLVMRESRAREMGLPILGILRDYAYAGLQPQRMGLGPVFATARLLARTGATMGDIDLIELNEAFAAQVIANERAFASAEFAKRELGRDSALGEIDRERMNVNGGAIALGHPVGMTGTRLVLTALKEMERRKVGTALATMCIGGGQGGALFLEAA